MPLRPAPPLVPRQPLSSWQSLPPPLPPEAKVMLLVVIQRASTIPSMQRAPSAPSCTAGAIKIDPGELLK